MYKRNITGRNKFHRMGRRTGSANLPIPTSMYSELSKSTAINYDSRHRQKSPSSIGKHGNFLAVKSGLPSCYIKTCGGSWPVSKRPKFNVPWFFAHRIDPTPSPIPSRLVVATMSGMIGKSRTVCLKSFRGNSNISYPKGPQEPNGKMKGFTAPIYGL